MDIKDYLNIDNNYEIDETGFLREKKVYSSSQGQTEDTFSFKWAKTETYNSDSVREHTQKWLMTKYFNDQMEDLERIFSDSKVVLDAGCGGGLSIECLLGERLDRIKYIGVDISDAVVTARENFKKRGYSSDNKLFAQCDLNHIPLKEKCDVIFSEGVLHHTDSTKDAILNLSEHLKVGGYFLFYVYVKKAPIREYTDDLIREYFREKTNQETWDGLLPLTQLGEALGKLKIDIDVPEDIPFLGIKKGSIDLQRLFYWHIFKCFYKDGFTIEEMNHVNFDWYRPINCHRQTPEEVREWCGEAGLAIKRMYVEESGISVVAIKD